MMLKSLAFAEKLSDDYEYLPEDRANVIVFAETGYAIGGQITHKTMHIKNGVNICFSVLNHVNPQLEAGLGGGFIFLGKETFIPMYGHVKINLSENLPSYFLSLKLGYSYGYFNQLQFDINTSFRAGLFIEPSFGYMFDFPEDYSVFAGLKITSQFGTLIMPESNYSERLNFVLLVMNMGIRF